MDQIKRHRPTLHRVHVGQIGVAAIALAGVTAPLLVAGVAGAATNHGSKGIVISTAKNSKLGTLLVSGTTLYTLNKSDCTGQCLKVWPEVLLPKGVTKATAGSGVSASKLGTVKGAGGALQVTYSGKALYWFSADKAAGQVHGNGLKDAWGTWSVFVTAKPTSTSSGGGSSPTTTSPSTGGVSF